MSDFDNKKTDHRKREKQTYFLADNVFLKPKEIGYIDISNDNWNNFSDSLNDLLRGNKKKRKRQKQATISKKKILYGNRPIMYFPDCYTSNMYPDYMYMRNDEQSNAILGGGYSYRSTWGALIKCWKAYKIEHRLNNAEGMVMYAMRIQSLQQDLGMKVASFPHLGLLGDDFFLYDKHAEAEFKKYFKENGIPVALSDLKPVDYQDESDNNGNESTQEQEQGQIKPMFYY